MSRNREKNVQSPYNASTGFVPFRGGEPKLSASLVCSASNQPITALGILRTKRIYRGIHCTLVLLDHYKGYVLALEELLSNWPVFPVLLEVAFEAVGESMNPRRYCMLWNAAIGENWGTLHHNCKKRGGQRI